MKLDNLLYQINRHTQGNEILAKDYFISSVAEREAETRLNKIKNSDDSDSVEGLSTGSDSSISNGSGDGVDGNGNSDTHADTLALTAGKLVKEKEDVQMAHVTSPETQLSYGISKPGENIEKNIQAFQIKGGPAVLLLTMIFTVYRLLLNMYGQKYLIKKYRI